MAGDAKFKLSRDGTLNVGAGFATAQVRPGPAGGAHGPCTQKDGLEYILQQTFASSFVRSLDLHLSMYQSNTIAVYA